MKRNFYSFTLCAFFALLLTSSYKSDAQTAGTLNFTATIATQTGSYSAKHYVAIWIEDNSGTFVKTKNRFGATHSATHLCQWKTKSTSNLTDATTGATISSYTSPVAIATWNGTNVAGTVVADGVYKVWIETSWDDATGNCGTLGTDRQYTSLTFTKGASAVHLTGQVSSIFTMTLDWVPTVTTVVPTVSTTIASAILQTTASSGGNVTADGGATVTAKGICWGTNANPIVTGSHTTDGTGTGTFTSSITGLTAGTLYHYRAYATNSVGTAYGTDLTFSTTAAFTIPTVTTMQASSITQTTASAYGSAQTDGGSTITAKGICWGLTTDPTIAGSHTTDGTGIGTFISNITSLTPGTLYHFRAYATNSVGTAYGSDMTFTTLANTTYTVSGTVNYLNTASTALTNVTVTLTMTGTSTILTTTTNGNGFYSFSNVANGSYTIACSTTTAWGGVTAIDALKINRHIAGLEIITSPIKLSSGDVNITGNISSTDVLLINRRAAGLSPSFTRPDWIFEIATTGGNSVTVNSANAIVNIEALCAGDFNGSYIPMLK